MKRTDFFRILDRVGSTNNYAMAELHAGMASHGMAWFAKEQNAGKGQRGKEWITAPGENIIMSIVIEPAVFFAGRPFVFNMAVANACCRFLDSYFKNEIKVKWPNDIYLRDRKAGGILIENIYRGTIWKWAVVGIGINVNQVSFPEELKNAGSLKAVSGDDYNPVAMGKALYEFILHDINAVKKHAFPEIIKIYNQNLYKAHQKVRLRKENMVFETTIAGVNEKGELLTVDSLSRHFEFGEVEWLL